MAEKAPLTRVTDSRRESTGWRRPGIAKKWHFFLNGTSLCGRWLLGGPLDENQTTDARPGPDDCRACHAAHERRLPPCRSEKEASAS